ncbi:MAG: 30S ribosomal protein S3 [Verrucomicrobiota bacterium]
MGQKVNPVGFRLAVNKDWASKWYAPPGEFPEFLHADIAVRKYLKDKLAFAAVSKILIERAWNSVRVTLYTARPGLVIGRKGSEIERMTDKISGMCGGRQVKIDIVEIKQPETDAQLVAESVALQLERRISFRRAMKRSLQTAMDFGAEGIRIRCAGRLGGADIARAEWYREGKVPLQTLRVPIDYGFAEAKTVYGIIGVKCWINRNPDSEKSRMARVTGDNRRDGKGGRRDGRGGRGPGGGGRGPGGGGGGRGPGGGGGGQGQGGAPSPAPAEEASAAPAETPAPATAEAPAES